jgi:TetR/AcrR family transcriptional regulator
MHSPRPESSPHAEPETRAAILSAAERIFAEAGLAGARIDAIAAAAGVNKALLYYYFENKDALYLSVLEERMRGFCERAMAVLTAPGSPKVILLRYVDMFFEVLAEQRNHASLHDQMMSHPGPAHLALIRRHVLPRSEALNLLVRRGIREGEFRKVDVRHFGISLVSLIVFFFKIAPMLKEFGMPEATSESELRRRKREVFDFIRHGLFVHPEEVAK